MRVRFAIAFGCLATMLAGCGGGGHGEPSTPVACLEGTGAYLRALQAAPGEVRLGGETPISDCLVENQAVGELATVGEAMVEAATRLNAQARAEDGGKGAVALGYLLGAARRGAETTEGIHSELIRRLTVAARYAPGHEQLSVPLIEAYKRGYDAGHSGG